MKHLLEHLTLHLDPALYLKDPANSEVGQQIIRLGSELIARDGLENFTFKKLATEMGSPESTIYRYFSNKSQLMLYLSAWYWSLLEWKIVLSTANVEDKERALDKLVEALVSENLDFQSAFFDPKVLHKLVVRELSKSLYICQPNDNECAKYFGAYDKLCTRIEEELRKYNPRLAFPKALAVTLVETAHYHLFLKMYMPYMTEIGCKPHLLNDLLKHMISNSLLTA